MTGRYSEENLLAVWLILRVPRLDLEVEHSKPVNAERGVYSCLLQQYKANRYAFI